MRLPTSKAKMVIAVVLVLLMALGVFAVLPVHGQSYIDQGLYGMGWWGESAKIAA